MTPYMMSWKIVVEIHEIYVIERRSREIFEYTHMVYDVILTCVENVWINGFYRICIRVHYLCFKNL
jgi:hypothetical protein